jgi:hypothetical protein
MMRLLAGLMILVLGLSGCRTTAASAAARGPVPRFFLEAAEPSVLTVTLPRSGVRLSVNPQPVITEGDIVDVALAQVDLGKCLAFQVSPAASRDLYRLTGSHQGRRLVLVVDGAPLGARRIDGPLADGIVFVFVEVADELLPKLVEDLRKSSAATQRELARKG